MDDLRAWFEQSGLGAQGAEALHVGHCVTLSGSKLADGDRKWANLVDWHTVEAVLPCARSIN